MSVTIKDVANRAGVSIATVSRYFSSREKLKESTVVRVQKAIESLDYIPNSNARNLKKGSSKIIGLIVPDITINLFYIVAKALNDIFYNHGYFLMVCDSGYRPERERHHIVSLLEINAELIIVATTGNNAPFLADIASRYSNLILLDRYEPEVNTNSFCYDHMETAKRLAMTIVDRYPRDYVIMMGPTFSPVTRDRLKGILSVFDENNIRKENIQVIDGICSSEQAENALLPIIERHDFPKTIIFSNQNCLEGLARVLWKSDVKVKKDLYIGGFATARLSELYNIEGICAIQDHLKIGMALGDFCIKKLSSKKRSASKKVMLDVSDIIIE